MFQELAKHGAHPDILGQARNAGPQCAGPAHDQFDPGAVAGCLVQGLDDLWLQQGVHLGDDQSLAASLGVLAFAADGFEQRRVHGER